MPAVPDLPIDPGCLFCKIVAGRIPCHRLHEDDRVLSFLDIGPLSRGHALVIPRGHWQTIDQMPDEDAASCMRVVPRLSRAIRAATGAAAWNILQNNGSAACQVVPHVHFHIIPRTADAGLTVGWPAGKLGDDEARQLVAAIRAAM